MMISGSTATILAGVITGACAIVAAVLSHRKRRDRAQTDMRQLSIRSKGSSQVQSGRDTVLDSSRKRKS